MLLAVESTLSAIPCSLPKTAFVYVSSLVDPYQSTRSLTCPLATAYGSVRGRIFPCIGLYPCDVSVRVNFGTDETKPFKYANWKESIEEHKDDEPLCHNPVESPDDEPMDLTYESIRLLRRKQMELESFSSPVSPV